MELLKANFLDTSTMIVVDSNTDLAANLFNRDTSFQYVSSGYGGSTKTTIRINFSETKTVSRIALLDHNLKKYRAYYNGLTASTFALISGDTTVSDYGSNSETSQYLQFTPVACTSVSFDLENAMTASEKAIGYMVISEVLHSFDREPPARGYKPKLLSTDIEHKLSDGGIRIQTIAEKNAANLAYTHITATEKRALKAVWLLHQEMIFAPFGTTTSWDGVIFPCVWQGAFDFEEFSDSAVSAGFTGKINLLETPN